MNTHARNGTTPVWHVWLVCVNIDNPHIPLNGVSLSLLLDGIYKCVRNKSGKPNISVKGVILGHGFHWEAEHVLSTDVMCVGLQAMPSTVLPILI